MWLGFIKNIMVHTHDLIKEIKLFIHGHNCTKISLKKLIMATIYSNALNDLQINLFIGKWAHLS